MTNADDLPEPTRCYVDGCDRENELLLHVADDAWLGGDFCIDHARAIVASTPLILTCGCVLCERARRVFSGAADEPRLEGPDRWLVSTESSSYLLELDESGSGTVVRHVGEGQGPASEAEGLTRSRCCRPTSRSSADRGPSCWPFATTVCRLCGTPRSSGRSSPTR